ncbi:hypothetical protein ACJJTC_002911 [Scirpophaga incertulas]
MPNVFVALRFCTDMKVSEEEIRSEDGCRDGGGESSEDILAKYRRSSSEPKRRASSTRRPSDVDPELDKSEGVVDLNVPEVFNSMKRKLRIVLSNPEFYVWNMYRIRARCPWWSGCVRRRWARAARRPARWPALWRARCLPPPRRAWPPLCAPTAPRARPYAAYLARCRAALLAAARRLAARPYAAYLARCRARAAGRRAPPGRVRCLPPVPAPAAAPTPPTWRAVAPRCWPPRAAWPRECFATCTRTCSRPYRRLPGALSRRAAGRRAPPGRVSVLHLYPHLQPPLRRLPGALSRRAAGRRAPPGRVSVCTCTRTCSRPYAAYLARCRRRAAGRRAPPGRPPLRRLPGALSRRAAGRRAPPGRVSVCTCTRTCSRPLRAYLARCRAALLARRAPPGRVSVCTCTRTCSRPTPPTWRAVAPRCWPPRAAWPRECLHLYPHLQPPLRRLPGALSRRAAGRRAPPGRVSVCTCTRTCSRPLRRLPGALSRRAAGRRAPPGRVSVLQPVPAPAAAPTPPTWRAAAPRCWPPRAAWPRECLHLYPHLQPPLRPPTLARLSRRAAGRRAPPGRVSVCTCTRTCSRPYAAYLARCRAALLAAARRLAARPNAAYLARCRAALLPPRAAWPRECLHLYPHLQPPLRRLPGAAAAPRCWPPRAAWPRECLHLYPHLQPPPTPPTWRAVAPRCWPPRAAWPRECLHLYPHLQPAPTRLPGALSAPRCWPPRAAGRVSVCIPVPAPAAAPTPPTWRAVAPRCWPPRAAWPRECLHLYPHLQPPLRRLPGALSRRAAGRRAPPWPRECLQPVPAPVSRPLRRLPGALSRRAAGRRAPPGRVSVCTCTRTCSRPYAAYLARCPRRAAGRRRAAWPRECLHLYPHLQPPLRRLPGALSRRAAGRRAPPGRVSVCTCTRHLQPPLRRLPGALPRRAAGPPRAAWRVSVCTCTRTCSPPLRRLPGALSRRAAGRRAPAWPRASVCTCTPHLQPPLRRLPGALSRRAAGRRAPPGRVSVCTCTRTCSRPYAAYLARCRAALLAAARRLAARPYAAYWRAVAPRCWPPRAAWPRECLHLYPHLQPPLRRLPGALSRRAAGRRAPPGRVSVCTVPAPAAAPTPPTWRAVAPRCWPPRAAWPRECLHLYPHLQPPLRPPTWRAPPLRRLPGALPRRATPPTWRAAAPRCWPPRAAWPRECLHLYPHLQPPLRRLPGALSRRAAGRRAPPGRPPLRRLPGALSRRAAGRRAPPGRRECLHLYPHLQPPLRRLPGALSRRAAGRRAPPGRVSVCTSAPTPPTWRAAAPRCWPPRAAWPRECLHLYPHLQPPLRRLPGRAAAPRCWPPRAAWPRECLHLYPHLQPPLRRLPGALSRRAAGRRAPPGRVSVCTCTRTCSRPYAAYLARCRAALLAAARRLAA